MLRASALVEEVGVPSVSLTCEGFLSQAASTASGLGMPNLPVALVPGHVDVQSAEELRRNVLEVTVDAVIQGLTVAPDEAADVIEPRPSEIVFEGTPDEVNRVFYENGWSDGLPIVPPTEARVREFLRFTDRDADEELGVLLPDMRSASVRTVAVNGVMAGCRPEYMPVLVALVEAMADRRYGVEHSGNTPGAETLIVLNGPVIRDLGFNYRQGALRDGFQANTTVGRFWRLYLRNVAGFHLHRTDKGTFGNT
ncbi:MAG TPA: UGSC family (seleno)protein, partial [Methylomirabilota bacterium]